MTKRKNELSFMNILLCLAVIFIHVVSWTLPNMDRASIKYAALLVPWRLSAFAVQGFLFLSGVKLFASDKPFRCGSFILGRVTKIFVPYLLWVGVYYAYFIGIGWYTFSWEKLFEYITLGTLCSHFYYIIIAMQFYLLMPLLRLLVKHVSAWLLCALSVVMTAAVKLFVHFQYDDRVFFTYLCYFVIGAVVGKNYAKVTESVKKLWLPIGGVFALFAFADAFLTYHSQVHGAYYPYFEALHLCYCLSAIFFLFAVGLKLFEKREFPKFLSLVDRTTFGAYLSHVLFIYIANGILYRRGVTDMLCTFILRAAFTYVVTFAVCTLYTLVKEKLKNAKRNA